MNRPAQVVKGLDQMAFGRLNWLSEHYLVIICISLTTQVCNSVELLPQVLRQLRAATLSPSHWVSTLLGRKELSKLWTSSEASDIPPPPVQKMSIALLLFLADGFPNSCLS